VQTVREDVVPGNPASGVDNGDIFVALRNPTRWRRVSNWSDRMTWLKTAAVDLTLR
jgi:hypothetical protein